MPNVTAEVDMLPISANPTKESSVTLHVGEFRYETENVIVQDVAAVAVVIVPDWSSPTIVPVPVPQVDIEGAGPLVQVWPLLSSPITELPVEVDMISAFPIEEFDWMDMAVVEAFTKCDVEEAFRPFWNQGMPVVAWLFTP
jgi:hypothetical protein